MHNCDNLPAHFLFWTLRDGVVIQLVNMWVFWLSRPDLQVRIVLIWVAYLLVFFNRYHETVGHIHVFVAWGWTRVHHSAFVRIGQHLIKSLIHAGIRLWSTLHVLIEEVESVGPILIDFGVHILDIHLAILSCGMSFCQELALLGIYSLFRTLITLVDFSLFVDDLVLKILNFVWSKNLFKHLDAA